MNRRQSWILLAAAIVGGWLMLLPPGGSLLAAATEIDRDAAPQFSFGAIADVQYADKETSGQRRYRESLKHLQVCLADLNQRRLAFIANLGDIIDGSGDTSVGDLNRVLEVFARSRVPVRHAIGNHCLEVARPVLLPALGLRDGYYTFGETGWRFVVLDTMEISLKAEPGSEEIAKAQDYLAERPGLPTYNGAVSATQLEWLQAQLQEAQNRDERVVILSHHPLLTSPERVSLAAWNAADVREILHQTDTAIVCFSGHDHQGGYTEHAGIHYVTLPGMVEGGPDATRYAIVHVFQDHLKIEGLGDVPSRTLLLPGSHAP